MNISNLIRDNRSREYDSYNKNELDRYKNGHSYPKTFNSWEILNDKIALKTVDKSVLIHHGTGIPIQTRYFFEIDKMVAGERKNINISYQNKNYEAYFELESSQTGRTRLLWYSDFRDILKLELPEYYEVIENSIELNKYIFPKIRFEKIN